MEIRRGVTPPIDDESTPITDPDIQFGVAMIDAIHAGTHRGVHFTELWNMQRYKGKPMTHKADLLLHTNRVNILATLLSQTLQERDVPLNTARIGQLADVHDVPEIVTGDIPADVKRNWTPEQKAAFKVYEREAIKEIANNDFPEAMRPQFIAYFYEASDKETLEAQVVDIADKWDGLCEAIHELRCKKTPEFLSILENYRTIFSEFGRYPIWNLVKDHPRFAFNTIPTIGETLNMPPISLQTFQNQGAKAFWEEVFDPKVPKFYRHWLFWSTMAMNRISTAAFPGWKQELGIQPQENFEEFTLNNRYPL